MGLSHHFQNVWHMSGSYIHEGLDSRWGSENCYIVIKTLNTLSLTMKYLPNP